MRQFLPIPPSSLPNFSLSDGRYATRESRRMLASVYSLSNKISLLATTLASRVFGLFGFCWSPASEAGPGTGIAVVPKLAACDSPPPPPPLGDIAPFAFCSVFSFFGSATEKKVRHRSEPWRHNVRRQRGGLGWLGWLADSPNFLALANFRVGFSTRSLREKSHRIVRKQNYGYRSNCPITLPRNATVTLAIVFHRYIRRDDLSAYSLHRGCVDGTT